MHLQLVSAQRLAILFVLFLQYSSIVQAQNNGIVREDASLKIDRVPNQWTLEDVLTKYKLENGYTAPNLARFTGRSILTDSDSSLSLIREYFDGQKVCRDEVLSNASAAVILSLANGERYIRLQANAMVLKQNTDHKDAFYATDPLAIFYMRLPNDVEQAVLLPFDSSHDFDLKIMFHLVDGDSIRYDIFANDFTLSSIHFYPPASGADTSIYFENYGQMPGGIRLPQRRYSRSRTDRIVWWFDEIYDKKIFDPETLSRDFGKAFFPTNPIIGGSVKYKRTYLIKFPTPEEESPDRF